MAHPATRILTLAFAAILSTAAAGGQTVPNQAGTAATTPTNVARVYVQTAKGVNVYNVSSTGNLTLVSGSPFTNTAGSVIGIAGSHLITASAHYLHSYAITSTGGIGAQAAQINTALYARPGDCGKLSTDGGAIDRTGTWAYIRLQGTGATCDLLQSYKIDAAGAFTFAGVAAPSSGSPFPTFNGPLVIAANNRHAYTLGKIGCENEFDVFSRDTSGAMNDDTSFNISFPPPPNGGVYFPVAMDSISQNVPTDRAVLALQVNYRHCESFSPPLLASYLVDYYGNLAYDVRGDVLKPAVNPDSMTINPQVNILAVAGSGPSTNKTGTTESTGLQVFHFNKGKITKYSNILTPNPIHSIVWDKSHHLYATSHARDKLYVFTVTPTSITQVAGSPFTLSGPSAIVVQSF